MSGKVGSGADSRSAAKGSLGSDAASSRRNPQERSPVAIGELVGDKYVVEEILAAGGMGVVVRARHATLDQHYAIKFLLPDAEHPQRVERFLREARAAARIESSHVCRVFDCGTMPSGIPYMVMEYLAGNDLSRELKNRGPLPVTESVDLLLQALEGIAEAHAVGIVHRDLKPSNLFLTTKPGRAREVKVLDFGVSKLTFGLDTPIDDDLTNTEAMLGSPRYMSPEQVQNAKTVDARADIWSLGVILYQMLDGKAPFSGTTVGEIIGKVLMHTPRSIRAKRPDVPEGVALILERCLKRERDQRYRSVAELAQALAPFASPAAEARVHRITALLGSADLLTIEPVLSSQAPLSQPAGELSLGTVGAFTQSSAGIKPRRTKRFVVAALVLVALFSVTGATAFYLYRPSVERDLEPVARPPVTDPTPAPPPKAAEEVKPETKTAPEPAAAISAAPSATAPTPPKRGRATKIGKPKDADLLKDSW